MKQDITVRGLRAAYDTKTVFDSFDAVFEAGEGTAIMGPSGCGKTTLINILMGLVPAAGGSITGAERLSFSCVFQEDRLLENLPAIRNLTAVCRHLEEETGTKALERIGISTDSDKPVAEYSGGMKRRVAIARAMLSQSDVVILDEPFKGLDETTKKEVTEFIRDTLGGRTLILVTHDQTEAQSLCGKTVCMSGQ